MRFLLLLHSLALYIMTSRYKVVTYVPVEAAESVKTASKLPPERFELKTVALSAGAGRIGAHVDVCFTIDGLSQFTPGGAAKPALGECGVPQKVREVKLEMTVMGSDVVKPVVAAIRTSHPYEEVVCDVYRLEDF